MSMDPTDRSGTDGTEDRAMALFAAAVGARLGRDVPTGLRDGQAAAAATVAVATGAAPVAVSATPRRRAVAWAGPLALAAGLLGVAVVGPALRGADDDLPLIAAVGAAAGPMAAEAAGSAVTVEDRGGAVMGPSDLPADLSLWRPVSYRFTLAPDLRFVAGAGTAWAFTPPSDPAGDAARLAALLDLGPTRPADWGGGALVAEGPDGAMLTVDPAGQWYFSAGAGAWPDWTCDDDGTCPPPAPAVGLPSDAAATRAALDLLGGTGVADVVVRDVFRDDWTVGVTLEVPLPDGPDGLGAYAGATFGSDGRLLALSGTLARPVVLGRYPTVDLETAVARLEADLAAGAMPMPLPATPEVPATPDVPPPPAEPEVVEVRIVRAEAAPSWAWTPEGRMLVVPHLRLWDADGGEWWVVAVDDRFLAPAG